MLLQIESHTGEGLNRALAKGAVRPDGRTLARARTQAAGLSSTSGSGRKRETSSIAR